MRLILKENSFQFNGKHYLQTHGIAMGAKMAVAFAVIFMAHIEKELLAASPFKPTLWKRFKDDIFSVWTISEQEINDFVSFANNFHPTIKFTCEMSSERIVFLDTEVFKGPRFAISKTLDVQPHFKSTQKTFQYTHFSSCHPLSVKMGFIKGETLRLLRANSVKENFESMKRDFQPRLPVRATTRTGYIVSCNLIGSDAEPKHWLDRERTKFQIKFSCRKYRMLVCYRENQRQYG